MKNFLIKIKDWAIKTNGNMILAAAFAVILIAAPFIGLIFIFANILPSTSGDWLLILSSITFFGMFMTLFYLFINYMNKL